MTSAHETPFEPNAPDVLAVDVGGSHVKILLNGHTERRRFVSGKRLTAEKMVTRVLDVAQGLEYEVVTVGVPAPVLAGRVLHEPVESRQGVGGVRLPVRLREADQGDQRCRHAGARQLPGRPHALPRARDRARLDDDRRRDHRADGARSPPVPEGDVRGLRRWEGHARLGDKRWRKAVLETIEVLVAALEPEYVVLGGGSAERVGELPPNCRLGANEDAFRGGFRLWLDA